MNSSTRSLRIIVADDDEEDILFVRESLHDNNLPADITEIENGEFLMRHLQQYKPVDAGKQPHLILMDINMPRKNGLEVLKEIKMDPELSAIPVVIFTTSKSQKDKQAAYDLGANCFITKPQTAVEWFTTIGSLCHFWTDAGALHS